MFTGLLLSGCRTAHMAVSKELVFEATEMTVKGRQGLSFKKSFTFGPYSVTDVNYGWTKTSSWGFQKFRSYKAEQNYEFILNETNGEIWEGQCATEVGREALEFEDVFAGKIDVEFKSETYFVCTFKPKGEEKIWKFVMTQLSSKEVMNGVLSDGKTQIIIQGSRKLTGSPILLSHPTGYEFFHEDHIIGAVEVINEGIVWLYPSLSSQIRLALATTSAALLLYQNLSEY